MPGLKRPREDTGGKDKRPRSSAPSKPSTKPVTPSAAAPSAAAPETDFPRGGGSGLTPLEHAQALREGRAERAAAGGDLFTDGAKVKSKSGKAKDGTAATPQDKAAKQKAWRENKNAKKKKNDGVVEETPKETAPDEYARVEHLNYKRLAPGSRLLCSVLAVHPLALVVSLPNQLLGHVPLTSISPHLNTRLEAVAGDESDSDEEESKSGDDEEDEAKPSKGAPELRQLYSEGDWVRASVVAVRHVGARSLGREGQEYLREAGRVELSLAPSVVNEGISSADVAVGTVLPVALRSREDHGWVLDSGVQDLAGFATFADVPASATVGAVLPALVTEHADGARSFKATLNADAIRKASLGPTQAPSLSGLIPGTQVNALITNVAPGGLSAKLWGLFDASIDATHLPLAEGKGVEDSYKVGQKLRARLLWDLGPQASAGLSDDDGKQGGRKLALSAAAHVMGFLQPPGLAAFPIGTQKQVRILRVDADWGLACEVEDAGAAAPSGFVHISNVADEHITALSPVAGPWREGTTHAARVIGHAPTDGRLLLSLQPSILAKTFMRVSDVIVGSVVKGTVARIGPGGNAIFIDLGGTVHGVVFPIHFADVPLRRPEQKYKAGSAVRARVLHIDPLRNRITCTLKKSLVASELPMIASLQDARTGVVAHAAVSRFFEPANGGAPTALLVDFFGGLRALVPAAEAAPDGAPASAPTALRSAYFEGKVVRVRLTHVDYATGRITASIRQASPSYLARLDVDAVALGERVEARLAAVHADVVVLELIPSHARALLSLAALAEERGKTVEEVRAELAEGEIIANLVVVDKNKDKGLVILGNSKAKPRAKAGSAQSVSVGAVVAARVVERNRSPNVAMLLLDGGVRARLHATDCADEFAEDPLPALESKVDVALLAVNGTTKKRAVASLRPSVLAAARGEEDAQKPRDVIIISAADVQVGQKYRGYVKSIVDTGLFVDLGRQVTARVKIGELFDTFIKEWKPQFKVGQLVEGTVTEADVSRNKIELSLKTKPGSKGKVGAGAKAPAAADEPAKPVRAKLSDYKKGQKVKGFVRAITDFGVFVQVEGTEISGLAHKKELSDNKGADALKAFSVGDRVRAVVLEVQPEKKRIAFGLKPSYFDAEDFEDSADEAGDAEEEDDKMDASDDDDDEEEESDDGEPGESDVEMDGEDFLKRLAADDSDEDMLQVVRNSEAEDSDEDEDSDDDEEDSDEEEESDDEDDDKMDEDEPAPAPVPAKSKAKKAADGPIAPALELAGGFSWSAPEKSAIEADSDASSASSDDEEDDVETSKARSKRRKGKAQAVQEDVTADLATKAPKSAADFERLLLGSPHSSFLWIQFMSFQLQLSDVERAREVARRALKVISFREEQERLNVWIALLNLENTYGTEETREAVFRQAAQAMDAKTVHMRMLAILEKSEKLEVAEELWRKTAKKFGGSSKVWVGWVQFYLRHDRQDEARKLIPRSMQALEKRKHVKTVLAIALSEYKIGDAERGRTIFEGLVDSHPKRLDIWLVYIAQEAKSDGNAAIVRDLYERVLALKLSSKKAKSTLKAWLRYEQERGDAAGEQLVLQKAKEWAEKHAPKDGDEDEEEE